MARNDFGSTPVPGTSFLKDPFTLSLLDLVASLLGTIFLIRERLATLNCEAFS